MMLTDYTGALRRRWYLVIAGLLLTGLLGYGAASANPPTYTARGLVLLLPSEEAVGEGGNPFLLLGGLDLPARVLVAYFSSDSAQEDVARQAPDAEVSVLLEESTRGPVIAIEVSDSTPRGAVETLRYVAGEIPANLARLQNEVGAPERAALTSMPLTMDTAAETDNGDALRMTTAAVAVGLGGTALLVFAVDGMLLRRRSRRLVVAAPEPEEPEAEEPEPEEPEPEEPEEPEPEDPEPDPEPVDETEPDDEAGEADEQEVGEEPAAEADPAEARTDERRPSRT